MLQSIFTAGTGLSQQQKRIDTIADNLANINTTGFKQVRVEFKDAIYNRMQDASDAQSTENLQKGAGVLINKTGRNFDGGSFIETGATTDVAIQGHGFFVLQDEDGQTVYTRAGDFQLSEENGVLYLTSADGRYVLDTQGQRIMLQGSADELSISGQGLITMGDTEVTTLAIVDFPNRVGLESVGGTSFAVTENSGEPLAAEGFEIVQGAYEGSNVQIADEMTLLIRTQRALQFASRALKTADEMDGLANSMRK